MCLSKCTENRSATNIITYPYQILHDQNHGMATNIQTNKISSLPSFIGTFHTSPFHLSNPRCPPPPSPAGSCCPLRPLLGPQSNAFAPALAASKASCAKGRPPGSFRKKGDSLSMWSTRALESAYIWVNICFFSTSRVYNLRMVNNLVC